MRIQLTPRREVYNFSEPYIIAEIGSNHNGDMDLAREMIDSAVDCGVDAVKFQSWTPQSLIAREEYDRNQTYDDDPKKHWGSLREMVEKYYLRDSQHRELAEYCVSKGVDFCSSAFSNEEADLLMDLNVPFFKVASMDINNLPFLSYLGKLGKPVVISTGMASLEEVENAVSTLEKTGNKQIVILHCISIYPPDLKDTHLKNISMLQEHFGYPVGFSDHSFGSAIPLASIALGSCVIEKHFTTDKDLPGWDHKISADPEEMKVICTESRNIAMAMGSPERTVSPAEMEKRAKFRRSAVAATDLPEGHILEEKDLEFKRPGTGIAPDRLEELVGKKLNKSINADDLLSWEDLSE